MLLPFPSSFSGEGCCGAIDFFVFARMKHVYIYVRVSENFDYHVSVFQLSLFPLSCLRSIFQPLRLKRSRRMQGCTKTWQRQVFGKGAGKDERYSKNYSR